MRRTRVDTGRLAPGVWFVRSHRGRGLTPVTPEGNRVALMFIAGMAASAVVVGGLAIATGTMWWMAVFVAGAAASMVWFIATAHRHGDLSVNAVDLKMRSEH